MSAFKIALFIVLSAQVTLVACITGDAVAPAAPTEIAEQRPLPANESSATAPAAKSVQDSVVSTVEPIQAAGPALTATPLPDSMQADANVLFVVARQESADSWHFAVTVEHPDLGWEDYADGWDVVLADGTVSKPDPSSPFTRLLLHPHETEQPFTRTQAGVIIPPGDRQVTVRAHDIIDGFGGSEVIVNLDALEGAGFEVQPLNQ